MYTYPIVQVTLNHPSFSWANGLYILLAQEPNKLAVLCRIDSTTGECEKHDGGRFMISNTSLSNTKPTSLLFQSNTQYIK